MYHFTIHSKVFLLSFCFGLLNEKYQDILFCFGLLNEKYQNI